MIIIKIVKVKIKWIRFFRATMDGRWATWMDSGCPVSILLLAKCVWCRCRWHSNGKDMSPIQWVIGLWFPSPRTSARLQRTHRTIFWSSGILSGSWVVVVARTNYLLATHPYRQDESYHELKQLTPASLFEWFCLVHGTLWSVGGRNSIIKNKYFLWIGEWKDVIDWDWLFDARITWRNSWEYREISSVF